ncbi:carboxyl transferase domain-containing protein [Conexibacter sp. JD483]|uniref:acyl-CoA carboxylase subunit beta n=1 Tax=unclassified Conexibacter TaxID=2627773 RepID=UPI0027257858|nr:MULTISPECIES: carboxyl transferase domain-containing protein [unclassified Conexibacter]MDO8189482.1 carboxyl transferase domain-containing protein [Conexibacter sp. CPCC 205706]MDO8202072.1 carboxyl transferase domain-containing protein [Conexibacter sp. CPCC 205762]MDR9372671.1 carboxyl transferase domain-containing protein [Conexibacter sp. JD483]
MSAVAEIRTDERLHPHERIELLCDEGSFEAVRSQVLSPKLGARARSGDGVVGGLGRIAGRPVAVYAQDARYLGGSLGAAHADTIHRVMQLAGRARVPVVGFIESGGARMQEGTAALGGYGRIFRQNVLMTGVVPQISIIGGLSAGGGCYSPALTDFVVMTEQAAMFLTGPGVVRDVMGEDVTAAELGGRKVHEKNGVTDLVAPDDVGAAHMARSLLSYLPSHAGGRLPRILSVDPDFSDPGAAVPDDPRQVYDVRTALRGIVDGGSLMEIAPKWARSIVTAFARIDGRPVGVIANQPRYMGGVLDVDSSQKGARFVETCDRYGIPLAVFVDTPGFMPGTRQEQAGVIRHGASLVRAFAQATVPRVTVVLRKAYGGAYITMNSKDLGADLAFAWPNAELGVMGAQPAVGVLHRRELAAAEDPVALRAELAAAYAEEHLGAEIAAQAGFVDEVIEPHTTRRRLAWAFDAIDDRRAVQGVA